MDARLAPIASMAADRRTSVLVAAAGAVQLALVGNGMQGIPCPALDILGVPCPGCGLTRAVLALGRGDFASMCELHAMAPVVAGGLLVFAVAAVLPAGRRDALVTNLGRFEVRSNFSRWMAAAFVLYWAARLALGPAEFVRHVAA